MAFKEIDINKYNGNIDEIVVMDKGKPETAMVLLGWDELDQYNGWFTNPVYAKIMD